MAADTQTLQYIISFKTTGQAQAVQAIQQMNTALGGSEINYKKVSGAARTLGFNIGQLAARAAITIPIWLAMRTAFMGMLKTIEDGAKYIIEFDAAIRRMTAVSSEVVNMTDFMSQLGAEIKQLSTETGRSVKDISDIYIQLAETGMKASTAQAGMNVALKLAIGTFSEAKDVGRIMVDLYNLFGDTMDKNLTPMEKMQMIGGTFTSLWKENSGTLKEYIDALKMFAPVAKLNNLSMQETLTTAIVLNNYMQRGTMGGTQLQRAFTEIAKNADKFDKLGVNVRGRVDGMRMFLDVLTAINKQPIDSKNALLTQLFGERSQRGVAVLATDTGLSKVLDQLKNTENLTLSQAVKSLNDNYMLQNQSLSTQVKIFDQLRKQAGAAFLIGVMGANDYEDAIKKAGEALYSLNKLMQDGVIPGLQYFGNILNTIATDPLLKLTLALSGVLLILRQLVVIIPAVWTALAANPVGLTLTAIAAALLTASAVITKVKTDTLTKKTAFLKTVSEGAQAGVPVEKYLQAYDMPGGPGEFVNKKRGWWDIFNMTEEDDPIYQKVYKKQMEDRGFATNAEILDAYEAPTINAKKAAEMQQKEEQAAYEAAKPDLDLKQSLLLAERLKAFGFDSLQIEVEKYRIMKTAHMDAIKLAEQEQKILAEQVKMVNEYAGIISSKLQNAFTGIMAGTENWSSIGKALNDSFVEGFRKSVSESLTNVVMATGLGDLFGTSMASIKGVFGGISGKIEGAFDIGGKATYNWIVRGFSDGRTGVSTGGSNAAAFSGAAGMSGAAGAVGGLLSSGWFGQPLNSNAQPIMGAGGQATGFYGLKSGKNTSVSMTGGQMAYAGLQGAMTGYSAYQSARQSGTGQMASVASGVMSGLGGIAGGIAGGLAGLGAMGAAGGATLLGMGPIGWAVLAGALIIGGIFMSSASKKKTTQTSVETKSQTTELASKIDVSNKKLELINRNLVALRNTMETYILPSSTYFSTARNLEDEFSLSARRG